MKLTNANHRLTLSTALWLSAFALNGCGGQPDDALDEVSLGAKPGGSGGGGGSGSTSLTLTIASLSSGLRLSWTSSSRPSSFKVLHSLDGVTYSQLASVSGRTTSYTHSGLESCVPHFYQVQACSTSSCGTPSNAVSGFATNQISVTSLLASLDGTNAAQLQWTASSASDSGFIIERSASDGPFSSIATAPALARAHLDTGLAEATTYSYRVTAVGACAPSDPATLTTPSAALPEIVMMSGGNAHALALRNDGAVFSFGSLADGRLGHLVANGCSGACSTVPVQITNPLPQITAVAAGSRHSLALAADGTVYAWGSNLSCALGRTTDIKYDGNGNPFNEVPKQVPGLSNVSAIAAGGNVSIALLADGRVMTWGANDRGQLGQGTIGGSSCVPTAVSLPAPVSFISAGDLHILVVLDDSDHSVFGWGRNFDGQLAVSTGICDTTYQRWCDTGTPVRANGSGYAKVAAGQRHSLLLKTDGTVWGAGGNFSGELGNYLDVCQGCVTVTPRQSGWVDPVSGQFVGLGGVSEISAGGGFSLARVGGSVYTFGSNIEGRLGRGAVGGGANAIAISGIGEVKALPPTQGGNGYVLMSDRTVMSWGRGYNGALGNGTSLDSNVPVFVSNLPN